MGQVLDGFMGGFAIILVEGAGPLDLRRHSGRDTLQDIAEKSIFTVQICEKIDPVIRFGDTKTKMTAHSDIWVVVKERNEYSHAESEDIAYFNSKEEADVFLELQQTLQKLKRQDYVIREPYVFYVKTISRGPSFTTILAEIEKAKADLAQKIKESN